MLAASAIAVVSAALSLYTAALALRVVRVPGARGQRWFAIAAACGGVYSACSPAFALASDDGALLAASRLQFAAAIVAFWAWLRFAGTFLELVPPRPLRILSALLPAAGVLGLVPGVAIGGLALRTVGPAALHHRDAVLTVPGIAFVAGVAVASSWMLAQMVRAWRRGVPHARSLTVSYAVLCALGVNDALATATALPTPFVLDIGFAFPIVAVSWLVVGRLVGAARALEVLQAQLLEQIEVRTQELSGALEALHQAEKLASLGEFAAGVAHEVNSPASVVTANLRFVEDACRCGAGRDEIHPAIEDALAAMHRINTLVRRLVDAGRVASSLGTTNAVCVADTAASVLAAARAGARADVALVSDVARDLEVKVRTESLDEVLRVLVENGIEAIPAGRPGCVRIHARRGEGSAVRITVEDDGAGMSPEVLRRAFDPFFTTKPDKATGLGLSVARGLTEGSRGALWLESVAGEGTRAILELPAAEPGAASTRRPTPLPLPAGRQEP